jgi:hypothetical protein
MLSFKLRRVENRITTDVDLRDSGFWKRNCETPKFKLKILYTNLSVTNTPCLFIYLFSIILGYMFRSHGPSSGLQHYHNTDPNYSVVTIEISTALHGKLCFSVKTQTKSRFTPWTYVLLKLESIYSVNFYLLKFLKTNVLLTGLLYWVFIA